MALKEASGAPGELARAGGREQPHAGRRLVAVEALLPVARAKGGAARRCHGAPRRRAAASLRRCAVTRSPARPGPSAPSVDAHGRRPSTLLTVALLTMTGAHGLRPAAHVAASGALVPRAERSARRRHFPLPVPHRQVEPCLTRAPPTPHPGPTHASPGPRPRLTRAPPTPHCLTGRAWTKAEVASALGSSAAMLDTATLYAGLLVLRRSPEAEAFLEEWLELTMRGALSPSAHPPCLASTPSCRRGARSR